jgi:hypothetical protein
MARHQIPSVSADFKSVVEFLTRSGAIGKPSHANLTSNARKVHAATYSLILWRFRLGRLPFRGRVFVDEIASDALQILPQMTMGYGKTVTLLARGIIENAFRHIYFMDHPVEFERMNLDKKWFMPMKELFEYTRLLPPFTETEQQFDAINQLSSLYSELSAGGHGRTVQDLETRIALSKVKYDDAAGGRHTKATQSCAAATNFLLAMFHRAKVRKFQEEDRRIILRTMPARAREIWTDYGS